MVTTAETNVSAHFGIIDAYKMFLCHRRDGNPFLKKCPCAGELRRMVVMGPFYKHVDHVEVRHSL